MWFGVTVASSAEVALPHGQATDTLRVLPIARNTTLGHYQIFSWFLSVSEAVLYSAPFPTIS
jgi:hypothetical protein